MDDLEGAVADVFVAEARLSDCKRRVCELTLSIREVDDATERARLATYLYWHLPQTSARDLAEAITGRPGRKSLYDFLQMITPIQSGLQCANCGAQVRAATRQELRDQRRRAADSGGQVPRCDECPAVRRPESPAREIDHTSTPTPNAVYRQELLDQAQERAAATVNIRTIWGGQDVALGPAQIERFVDDPNAVAAEALGVAKDEYLEWLATWGSVQCDGVTRKGHRCTNKATGQTALALKEWMAQRKIGGYCNWHG